MINSWVRVTFQLQDVVHQDHYKNGQEGQVQVGCHRPGKWLPILDIGSTRIVSKLITGRKRHQDNISVKCIPPHTPDLYNKTGVCSLGIPTFFNFGPKHRLWVLVRTASARQF